MMPNAVLFDLDDTLHDDTAAYHGAADEVANEAAFEYGINARELKAAYVAQADRFWHGLGVSQLSIPMATIRHELWKNALAEVGVTDEARVVACAERYVRARAKRLVLFPGARELLDSLKRQAIQTGLITNGYSETHREKIALLGLAQSFDAIFIANEVGMLKPDPLFFAHACAELGSSPARTVMVGDRYDRDIAGAHEAGIRTIWFNIRCEPLPTGKQPPDEMVNDLAAVQRILLKER